MVKKIGKAFKWFGITGGLVAWLAAGTAFITHRIVASTLTIPNTFSNGQVADPAAVNANFSAIATIVNGGIDDTNWNGAGPKLSCANHLDVTASCLPTITLNPNAVHPAVVNTIGPVGSITLSTIETQRMAVNYTPVANSAGVLVTYTGTYDMSVDNGNYGYAYIRLFIGGNFQMSYIYGTSSTANANTLQSYNFTWIASGLPNALTTFEIRDQVVVLAGAPTFKYRGDILRGELQIQELKR